MKHFACSLVLLTLILASPPARAQTPPRIIDVHMHYNGDPQFIERLVTKLDSVEGLAFLLTNPEHLESSRAGIARHSNRLVGFGALKLDDPRALALVDQFHAAGFRGLGEITSPLKNYDDRSYWPIYTLAQQYGMILLFHTGIVNRGDPNVPKDVSVDRMRPTTLDGLARRFPKLTIIGAHLGNPDYAWAGEIARWNPNLFFDLSGSSLIKKQEDYTFFKSIFWWSGVVSPHTPQSGANAFEKLVFGSDTFEGELEEFDRQLDRYHKMLDACGVPKEAQGNIFAGTIWRILQSKP